MALCSIILNKSDETYYPGDTVTGTVCVDNAKPMKVRSVTISWSGVSTTSMGISKTTFKKNWLSGSQLMWVATDSKSELTAGVHEFPFSINLPLDCPPTHKMRHTKNAYKLEVVIDRPWKLNMTVEKEIIVTKKVDTHKQITTRSHTFRSGLIFNNGPVTFKLSAPNTAQPGERIDINVKVSNDSSTTVHRLYTCFGKEIHYHSRFQRTPCDGFNSHMCPLSDSDRGCDYKTIQGPKFFKVNVAPYSEQEFIVPFEVPKKATTPNFGNGLMAFKHYLVVGFYAPGSLYPNAIEINMDIGEEKKEKQEALEAAPPPYSS